MALETLPSVIRLSDRIVRILGQNPGKFTLQGTNTYLVGKKHPYVLLDTGEGRNEYIPHLEEALKQDADLSQSLISDIILTHKHHDHVNGLPSVLSLLKRLWSGPDDSFPPPRIHKFPLNQTEESFTALIESLPKASFLPSSSGDKIHFLKAGQIIHGVASTLHILHTPGHTKDSICLYLPENKALFTGDTVLGQGTSVFEELGPYMDSLRSLLAFGDKPGRTFNTVYPGHGPAVPDGPKLIKEYIQHRMEREEQIIAVLASPNPSGPGWSVRELVANIYASYPESLWPAAERGVLLHLQKLQSENRVCLINEQSEDRWCLVSKL